MENTEQKALAELKRIYYLINNGDLNQEGLTLYHTVGKILHDYEKSKSRNLAVLYENNLENATKFYHDFVFADGIPYDSLISEKCMVAYASQTAPKLVLPERMKSWGESDMRANTWNDCIDLFIRLNPHLTDPGSPK